MRELIDNVEQADFASVMAAFFEEVVRLNVIAVRGSETNAESVTQPNSPW